jgi:hypothetical protein
MVALHPGTVPTRTPTLTVETHRAQAPATATSALLAGIASPQHVLGYPLSIADIGQPRLACADLRFQAAASIASRPLPHVSFRTSGSRWRPSVGGRSHRDYPESRQRTTLAPPDADTRSTLRAHVSADNCAGVGPWLLRGTRARRHRLTQRPRHAQATIRSRAADGRPRPAASRPLLPAH